MSLLIVPVGGAVLSNGRVIFWASNVPNNFTAAGSTYSALFDPATNSAVGRNVTETGHDRFCPGTVRLVDVLAAPTGA